MRMPPLVRPMDYVMWIGGLLEALGLGQPTLSTISTAKPTIPDPDMVLARVDPLPAVGLMATMHNVGHVLPLSPHFRVRRGLSTRFGGRQADGSTPPDAEGEVIVKLAP
jgi:hypothetical protein